MDKKHLKLLEKQINLFNKRLETKISLEDFNEITEDIEYIYSEVEKEKVHLKEEKVLTDE